MEARHAEVVDDAVARLPFWLRGLVRPRLTSLVWSCDGWTTAVLPEGPSVQCRGRAPLVAPAAAPSPYTTEDGRTVQLQGHAGPDALGVDAVGRHGSQESRWVWPDADTLVVTRTIRSPWLRSDVTWAVRYRRTAASP